MAIQKFKNGKIYKPKGKDYYYIRGLTLGFTPDGQEIMYQNNFSFDTLKEAQHYREKIIKDREKGFFLQQIIEESTAIQKKELTLQEESFILYAERFLNSKKLAYKTYCDYQNILKLFIKPFFKDLKIKDITGLKIRQFTKTLQGNGNIPRTRIFLNQVLDDLLANELITYSGYKNIKYPVYKGKGSKPKESLTEDELAKFLDYFRGHWLEHIIHLLFNTGMRPQEVQALYWNDIEIQPDNSIYVTVNKAWGLTEIGYGIKETKNFSSNRRIYIPPNLYLVNLLRKAFKNANGCKYVAYNSWRTAPISTTNLTNRYFKVAGKITLKKNVTAHVARHTYISICLAKGISPYDIIKQTGHATIEMIVKTYGHAIKKTEDVFKNIYIVSQ